MKNSNKNALILAAMSIVLASADAKKHDVDPGRLAISILACSILAGVLATAGYYKLWRCNSVIKNDLEQNNEGVSESINNPLLGNSGSEKLVNGGLGNSIFSAAIPNDLASKTEQTGKWCCC